MVQIVTVEKPLINCNCQLAEGPTFDYRSNLLFWVDIEQKRVYWSNLFVPSIAQSSHSISYITASDRIGVLGLTAVPGIFVVGAKKGFAKLDLREYINGTKQCSTDQTVELSYISVVHNMDDKESEKMRFNDGYVDANGRFFAGTMVDAGHALEPCGNVYRLSLSNSNASSLQDYNLSTVISNVSIPNGMGWSPDNKTMYFTDSPTSTISKYDYDLSTGSLSNKSTFVTVQVEGMNNPEPDGLTISQDGHVWGAIWGSHLLRRYSPSGEIVQEFRFPSAERITCATFAGPNLDKLVVTTASKQLAQDGAATGELDQGGNLFVIDVEDTTGIRKNIFKEK